MWEEGDLKRLKEIRKRHHKDEGDPASPHPPSPATPITNTHPPPKPQPPHKTTSTTTKQKESGSDFADEEAESAVAARGGRREKRREAAEVACTNNANNNKLKPTISRSGKKDDDGDDLEKRRRGGEEERMREGEGDRRRRGRPKKKGGWQIWRQKSLVGVFSRGGREGPAAVCVRCVWCCGVVAVCVRCWCGVGVAGGNLVNLPCEICYRHGTIDSKYQDRVQLLEKGTLGRKRNNLERSKGLTTWKIKDDRNKKDVQKILSKAFREFKPRLTRTYITKTMKLKKGEVVGDSPVGIYDQLNAEVWEEFNRQRMDKSFLEYFGKPLGGGSNGKNYSEDEIQLLIEKVKREAIEEFKRETMEELNMMMEKKWAEMMGKTSHLDDT
ncbi:hypothetical protein KSS87_008437 [Heliosperma pusillum]|nr:hypothetical protein KSS87_008437 [Heliosperma pusillum]